MKKSGFKMKGYDYPGTSPVKRGLKHFTRAHVHDRTSVSPVKNENDVEGKISKKKEIEEAKKNLSKEAYNKNLENKASELYLKDRAFRTGGVDFTKVDEKTKIKYMAKAQNT